MKNFIILVKKVRADLGILFILAVTTVILIDFFLIHISEKFEGGERIGQLMEKLCLSYISAFVFYFLVVHTKTQKDKENLKRYIEGKVGKIIRICWEQIQSCASGAQVIIKDRYPDEEELNRILTKLNPNEYSYIYLGDKKASWLEYFNYSRDRTNNVIGRLLRKMLFLESELVDKLTRIEDCNHFVFLGISIAYASLGNKDMTAWQPGMQEYIFLVKELQNYAESKLKMSFPK